MVGIDKGLFGFGMFVVIEVAGPAGTDATDVHEITEL